MWFGMAWHPWVPFGTPIGHPAGTSLIVPLVALWGFLIVPLMALWGFPIVPLLALWETLIVPFFGTMGSFHSAIFWHYGESLIVPKNGTMGNLS